MFTVTLIGRVNVGKSTLFNRLIENRKAIVSKIPGTTRDRNYAQCLWRGEKFSLVDTGGIGKTEDNFQKEVKKQINLAIEKANLILFVLDIKEGLLPQDKEIAGLIRNSKKPVILVLNKADSLRERRAGIEPEILKLGMGQPFFVSAVNGSGVGDLLDEIWKNKKQEKEDKPITVPAPLSPIKIAIVGRPNVGKSSLVNAILGEERVIVSKIPHTTREPQDTLVSYKGQPILLIDTAGIRKRKKIKSKIEKIGVIKSLEVVRQADIILLLVDPQESVARQDKKLASYIVKYNKGVILVVNKWDLIKLQAKNQKIPALIKEHEKYLEKVLSKISWAPITFISAKYSRGTDKLLDLVLEIKKQQAKKVSPDELNSFLKKTIKKYKLPLKYWAKCRLMQDQSDLPNFTLKTNQRNFRHPSPEKFLEKRIRAKFGFAGTPMQINIRG